MQISKVLFSFALALAASIFGKAQDTSTLMPVAGTQGAAFIKNVDAYAVELSRKSQRIAKRLSVTNERMLRSYTKEEVRFRKALAKVDSLQAASFMRILDSRQNLASFVLSNPANTNTKYLSFIDSALGVLKISNKFSSVMNEKTELGKIGEAIRNTEILQQQFNKSEMLSRYLKESSSLIYSKITELKLPIDMRRITGSVSKYDQKINEYVSLLNNRKKVEQKVLQAAANTKIFKEFMQKNSILASMFRMPTDGEGQQVADAPESFQTREAVAAGINEKLGRLSNRGASGSSKEFAGGRSKLAEEKAKDFFRHAGITSGSQGNWNPSSNNSGLGRRFSFDLNFQNHREAVITTDIGLAVGYKLNHRSTIGLGAAYKLGLGEGIQHLSLSHQGMSLRSFIDWRVKNGISITGGYEMNFINAIKEIDQLKDLSGWQQSGLVGLTKAMLNGPGMLKSTKLQILWDILSYSQIPRAQPLIFRLGYSF